MDGAIDMTAASATDAEDDRRQDLPEQVERRRELGVIAASYGALEAAPNNRRADIVIESVLQVLGNGPLAVERIAQDVGRLWATQAIPHATIRSALSAAQAAGLVVPQQTLLDTDWTLTDDARRDTLDDVLWAEGVLHRYEAEARDRLADGPNADLLTERQIDRIATRVREAIAIGAEGLYSLELAARPGALRPMRFHESEALSHLHDLQPRTVRGAAQRLLVGALNPADTFADELIHLLVTGNVLHGMVTRRDLSVRPDLSGTRLAVDTSVLLDLVVEGTDEAKAVTEAFRLSTTLGVELIVADHTIAEWGRLFDAADNELAESGTPAKDLGLLAELIGNPFGKAFAQLQTAVPTLTWARFRADWRDPTVRLTRMGLNVRPNGNSKADDQSVGLMRAELTRLNRTRPSRRLRTVDALRSDAQSAAMVNRWRSRLGEAGAFFISHDRMTGRAYGTVFPCERAPFGVTPAAWLTIAASFTTDDPDEKARCAQIVANVALRSSFFALAAGYTYDEVCALAEILNGGGDTASAADINGFIQQRFEE